MSLYIHFFETVSEYKEKRINDYVEPWVGHTMENIFVSYNKTEYEKLLGTPLTFEIISAGTIYWKATNTGATKTIEYSTDNGDTWTSITSTGEGVPISVNAGDKVLFKGDNAAYATSASYYNTFSGSTAIFNLEGNIMSLIDSTGFATATTLSNRSFYSLFCFCEGIFFTKNLILPATILKSYCYQRLFYNCTGLVNAPELPATSLANECYLEMFRGCTSLINAPEFSATTLEYGCCWSMFQGCTSLETAPSILPATTLTSGCYRDMFNGCTNLVTAPALPATTLAGGCYDNMFNGCTSLVNAPELPATTLTNGCYEQMFKGCTSLVIAPELLTTTLADYCYYSMFAGCTSLTTAPELPATTLADYCYASMFQGCTRLVIAPALPATTLTNSCYSYMFQNCSKINYIKCLATDISASYCTSGWVNGVASTGTFVKNASMSDWTRDASGIPNNWTVQDA